MHKQQSYEEKLDKIESDKNSDSSDDQLKFIKPSYSVDIDEPVIRKKSADMGNQTDDFEQSEHLNWIYNRVASIDQPITQTGDYKIKYKQYPIITYKKGNSNDSGQTTVKRRYKDFEWLYDQLVILKPGSIIPSQPPKHVLTKQDMESSEFIDERRKWLEIQLNNILTSRNLINCEVLTVFFSNDEKEFYTYKESHSEIEEDWNVTQTDQIYSTYTNIVSKFTGGDASQMHVESTSQSIVFVEQEEFLNSVFIYFTEIVNNLKKNKKAELETCIVNIELTNKRDIFLQEGQLQDGIIKDKHLDSNLIQQKNQEVLNTLTNENSNINKIMDDLELTIYLIKNSKDALERRTVVCEKYFELEKKKSRKLSDEEYVTIDSKLIRLKDKIDSMSNMLQEELESSMIHIKSNLDKFQDKYLTSEQLFSNTKCYKHNYVYL